MQAPVFPIDLHALLQLAVTAVIVALCLIHLIKVTSSRYFDVDDEKFDATASEEDRSRERPMSGGRSSAAAAGEACVLCGTSGTKKCSGCKVVRYCSTTCQAKHWQSDHKYKCRELKLLNNTNPTTCGNDYSRRSVSKSVDVAGSPLSLVPSRGVCKELKLPTKVLFPYDEFVKLFNWDSQGFSPCGLLNCGNSCFVNVVLQCLSCTQPLVAYLLEKGHLRRCRRNDWCFLCELQLHIQRARQSIYPFSPINILSRLPNIGGNLGYGNQEDAHEFMRFAIDTMQSVCLDEFGGEKVIDPITQETTLINHIFGGHLESQVVCTKCDKVSHRYESMMDLTVEIQGDASCLEECLDQFTIKEQLDGDNMYKCDGCNDYVKAWKRLSVLRAPNILTIALKRFQGGRFGKLNKRVTFPETLDLSPYMTDVGEDNNMYNLYGVVVHLDMLNASFFGHYICYIKDFCGNWYRIDDCKVSKVDLEEVLGQAAYMLLYSRVHVRNYLVKPLNLAQTEKRHYLVEPVSEKVKCMEVSAQPLAILKSDDSVIASTCDFLDICDPCAESNQKNDFQTRAEPMDIDTTFLDSFNLEEGSFGQHSQTCEDVSSVQVTPPVDSLLFHEEPLLGDCTTAFEETTSQATAVDDFHGEDQSEKTCGIDSSSQECPTDFNSTGDSINSKFEAIPSFISEAPNEEQAIPRTSHPTRVEQDVVSGEEDENSKLLSSVTAEIPEGRCESNSQRDCRPLFSPGFLNKPGCKMPLNKKEKFIRVPMDIGDCHQPNGFVKAPTFCQNGREASELSPDLTSRTKGVDDLAFPDCYNGELPTVNDRPELLCERRVNKHVISKKPILRPGFLNDQPKKRFLGADNRRNELDEKLLNYEVKNCNGFLDHAIGNKNGIMHHENGKFLYENDKDVQLNWTRQDDHCATNAELL